MGRSEKPEDTFNFILGEKEDLILILFCGKMGAQEISALETLAETVKAKPQPIVIMHFRDLSILMPGVHAAFAQMQKALREAKKVIGLSSLRPEIKMIMLQAGIIRESELFNNIPEAWAKLQFKLKTNPGNSN